MNFFSNTGGTRLKGTIQVIGENFYLDSYDCPTGHRCRITSGMEACRKMIQYPEFQECVEKTVRVVKGVWERRSWSDSVDYVSTLTDNVIKESKEIIFDSLPIPATTGQKIALAALFGGAILAIGILGKKIFSTPAAAPIPVPIAVPPPPAPIFAPLPAAAPVAPPPPTVDKNRALPIG